jgi:hypothetical protein
VVESNVEPFARALADEARRQRRTEGRAAVAHLATELVAKRLVGVYEEVLRARAGSRRRSRTRTALNESSG